MRLNLGCSDSLRGGEWLNVDIALGKEAVLFGDTKVAQIEVDPTRRGPDGKGCLGTVKSVVAYKFQQADLALPWPWDDSSVDEIRVISGAGSAWKIVAESICPAAPGDSTSVTGRAASTS